MVAPRDVAELVHQREHACRLIPERALETFEDAASFLDDRGMLTRTPDCALPSLFEACHEQAAHPGGQGFASWPATKWWWAGALEALDGVAVLKVHNGKNLLLTARTLRLADPICRAELDRFLGEPVRSENERLTRRLLDHLAGAGPSSLETIQVELGLDSRALKSLRHPLERCGAVVSRQTVVSVEGHVHSSDHSHVHSSVLCRYDQLVSDPMGAGRSPYQAYEDLIVAGVRAAVLAPERELARWFSWRWYSGPDFPDRLVDAGRLVRVGAGLVALG